MTSYRLNKRKFGNVIATLGIVIMIIIIVAGFFVTYQLNIIIADIKRDLFYISNNVLVSMDTQELSFGKYKVDLEKAKVMMEDLLNKNKHIGVNKIIVKEVELVYKNNITYVQSKIEVNFTPVINVGNSKSYSFRLQEKVAISLLQYGGAYE